MHSYESVSAEYYDARRHPTCANFTEASHLLFDIFQDEIGNHLLSLIRSGDFLDVGCGRSVLAQELLSRNTHWRRLVLADDAPGMLAHSRVFCGESVELMLATGSALPLDDASIDVATAFMGDPFNTPETWRELARVIRPGGLALLTMPSFEWANTFRSTSLGERIGAALFVVEARDEIHLPSHVMSRPEQEKMVQSTGFTPVAYRNVRTTELKGPLSAKLEASAHTAEGYLVRRT